jgi:exodeoxyribonuclease-5
MNTDATVRGDALSDEQRVAFDAAVRFATTPGEDTIFIGGQAGAGKTYLLSQLARRFPDAQLLAPIGKAAANLAARTGRPALTMHSFLYRLERIAKDAATGRTNMKWLSKHDVGEFAEQIVLLDEAPIAGERVVRDLLRTGCRIVAVGDPNQLRPVGQPPYFTDPDYLLTEPHRQALDSPIIKQAHRILRGHRYEADGEPFRVAPRAYDQDILGADIMLAWTHKQRIGLNLQSRALRGIRSPSPVAGEPLVCRKNCSRHGVYKGAIYELLEPFGPGDTVICIRVDGEPRVINEVKFTGIKNDVDEDEAQSLFDYGYAITVHSSAGSEWASVVVFDNYPRADADYGRWIYTAVTRASERLTVVTGR